MVAVTRPFVDRPVGDLDAATRLADRAALRWGLARPELVRVGMNAIFATDEAVIRVGQPSVPAAASIELSALLGGLGLRVARALRDEAIGDGPLQATCWERIEKVDGPIDWIAVGAMVRQLHTVDPERLPVGYPLPRPSNFPWWNFGALLDEVGHLLDQPARAGLDAAIARWPDWDDRSHVVVCHGDVHPGNVIMSAAGPVLIDWDLLCHAHPGWDHAPMMTWHDRWGGAVGEYERFARGAGESMRGDAVAEGFAELRLVAATLMRLKAGIVRADAMPEAQRRLAFWRGESDAAVWQAQ